MDDDELFVPAEKVDLELGVILGKLTNRERLTDREENKLMARYIQLLYEVNGKKSEAALVLGVHQHVISRLRRKHPHFEEAINTVMRGPVAYALEEAAYERAINGFDKYIIHKGEIMKDEKGEPIRVKGPPSDTLLMFLLRSMDRDRYSERVDINNTHKHENSGTIEERRDAMKEKIGRIIDGKTQEKSYSERIENIQAKKDPEQKS